jgi:hypothetical protein
MNIHDLNAAVVGDERILSARVSWEDRDFPEQTLVFAVGDGARAVAGPPADAFLTACFPLAAGFGEARLRIEGCPCPMLVEGLRTVHAWWASWGGMPAAPAIETAARGSPETAAGERRATVFLSGGVDGLHALLRNRRTYRETDPAYMREALFVHGFDIGKRLRDLETARFQIALERLAPVAAEMGLRLIPCRCNLRHLPSIPGFWTARHHGAALAAVGHAATSGPSFLFIASTWPIANAMPVGSHPAVDGHYSSQRVTVLHEGARFSRLDKVRDLASWPTALAALRVCPGDGGNRANCGRCEKCLRTRLELLAAGVEETAAFDSRLDLRDVAEALATNYRAIRYEDLVPPLRARGLDALCRVLEEKIAAYRGAKPVPH